MVPLACWYHSLVDYVKVVRQLQVLLALILDIRPRPVALSSFFNIWSSVCRTLLFFRRRPRGKKAAFYHNGLWGAGNAASFEDVLCYCSCVYAIFSVFNSLCLPSSFWELRSLGTHQEPRRSIRDRSRKVAYDVNPLLVLVENPWRDLVTRERRDRFLEGAGCPTQVYRLLGQGIFTTLVWREHIFEKHEHEFGTVVDEVRDEGAVGFVQVVVDI